MVKTVAMVTADIGKVEVKMDNDMKHIRTMQVLMKFESYPNNLDEAVNPQSYLSRCDASFMENQSSRLSSHWIAWTSAQADTLVEKSFPTECPSSVESIDSAMQCQCGDLNPDGS